MTPPEPSRWWLLHVDLDAFLASVEIRRRPELRGRPVVVGGDGDPDRARQVVATASYAARAFGVRSGMPLRQARRRCPDAVFLPTDHPAYDAASAEVMDVLRDLGHPVEVWGWDEAVLGATTDDPESLAGELRRAVEQRTELTCAVGIGDTKERAKMATGFAKADPAQVFRLDDTTWVPAMGHREVIALWGVGTRTAARLEAHGVATVAALAATPDADLAAWFGPTTGPRLGVLARGGSSRAVATEPWVARSRSHQVTYETDLTEPAEIAEHVAALARAVTDEIAAEGRTATHVGVTVRTSTFFTQGKTGKLPAPTVDPDEVARHALVVLDRFSITRPVRLLGVRVVLADTSGSGPDAADTLRR